MEFPNSLWPSIPIIHCFWPVFLAVSYICTKLMHVHLQESIKECHSWICTSFFSCIQHVLFVLLEWFLRWEMWPYCCCFLGVASEICLRRHIAFLYCSHLIFFSIRSVSIYIMHPYSSIDITTIWKISRFILLDRSDR